MEKWHPRSTKNLMNEYFEYSIRNNEYSIRTIFDKVGHYSWHDWNIPFLTIDKKKLACSFSLTLCTPHAKPLSVNRKKQIKLLSQGCTFVYAGLRLYIPGFVSRSRDPVSLKLWLTLWGVHRVKLCQKI